MRLTSFSRSLSLIFSFLVSTGSVRAHTNDANARVRKQAFWAGADIGTVLRAELIPGRVFYDYDGKTVKDPIQTLSDSGINSIRVETAPQQCLGPTVISKTASPLGKELLFSLSGGCIDLQVKTAERAAALGMKIQLTINMGMDIPESWLGYNYTQMLAAVQNETKYQLQPFLNAKIVPDIILFENEGDSGFLMTETSTGHLRGDSDGKASATTVKKEICGQIPTGNIASYPQLAGFYKAEILACNEAIRAANFSIEAVRYGLHSHVQYVQWKEGIVHGAHPPSENSTKAPDGSTCHFSGIIPESIMSHNASQMLTIMGFSSYPDPMTPADIGTDPAAKASDESTLHRLNATLTQLSGYSEKYGRHGSGPFKGQYRMQALGVEYATGFSSSQITAQQLHTEMMWEMVKSFGDSFLGMMWWEPWYCYNDWEGGHGALCKTGGSNGQTTETPTDTLKTWGAAAVSPWKVSNETDEGTA